MKELREIYFSIQTTFFPVLEEENIEISGKIKEFVECIEIVKPTGFLITALVQTWMSDKKTGSNHPGADAEACL